MPPGPARPGGIGALRNLPAERPVSIPLNASSVPPFVGSVLPLQRAEELLCSLPGVISARMVAGPDGAVSEIHVLTSQDVAPKATVRNIESALIAHLGMRVDHRKISVATTVDPPPAAAPAAPALVPRLPGRRLYFEDVEVTRSRARGVNLRVTLRKGDASFIGEAEGFESDRSRVELAARATLQAMAEAESLPSAFALEGVQRLTAFGREFVFAGVTARMERVTALLTGTCEIKDSAETAGVLAVLDATNRWLTLRQD